MSHVMSHVRSSESMKRNPTEIMIHVVFLFVLVRRRWRWRVPGVFLAHRPRPPRPPVLSSHSAARAGCVWRSMSRVIAGRAGSRQ